MNRSRVCRVSRLCNVNCYLDTTILSYHILSPLFLSPPPSSWRWFPGIHPYKSMSAPTTTWVLIIPSSYLYLHISCISASLICIYILCYVVGWYTPQQSTVLPYPAPPQWVGTPIFHLVSAKVSFPLVTGQPIYGISSVPAGGMGQKPTSPTIILGLTAPPLYGTSLAFLNLLPPGPRCKTPSSIYSALYLYFSPPFPVVIVGQQQSAKLFEVFDVSWCMTVG